MVYLEPGNNVVGVWSEDQEWQQMGIEKSKYSMGRLSESLQRFDFLLSARGSFQSGSAQGETLSVLELALRCQRVE